MTATQDDSQPRARRSKVSWHVDERARRLFDGKKENRSSAVADLARLRSGATHEIGSDPAVWRAAFLGYAENSDDLPFPSNDEVAVYTALSLYAYHQQGQADSMHTQGTSLGSALQRLAHQGGATTPNEAVVRRFNALVTADTAEETRTHLRSLVGQLRSNAIALDYGRLADDLVGLQSRTRSRVQLRWSRDFSRTPKADELPAEPPSPTATTN